MNAEKELLLKLLLEKYTEDVAPIAAKPKKVRYVHAKRRTLNRHKWTEQQKNELLQHYHNGGSLRHFAMQHNLRREQVDNMLYSLLRRNKQVI